MPICSHLHQSADSRLRYRSVRPPIREWRGGHVHSAENHSQAVANLARINAIVLLFRRRNPAASADALPSAPRHVAAVIVDPPGEDRGFHRCRPRLRSVFHPAVQVKTPAGIVPWA